MVRRLGSGLALPVWLLGGLLVTASCSQESVEPPVSRLVARANSEGLRAWIGGADGGPYVLVEELNQLVHAAARIKGEEELFRHTFQIPDTTRLLRVQLLESSNRGSLGHVVVGDTRFSPMSNAPEGLDDRARLYWHSVTQGVQGFLPESAMPTRLTYLVAAKNSPELDLTARLQWTHGELTIDLAARSWTELQRRAYLDAPADFHHE